MQVDQVFLQIIQILALRPVIGILVQVTEQFPILFSPVGEVNLHLEKDIPDSSFVQVTNFKSMKSQTSTPVYALSS